MRHGAPSPRHGMTLVEVLVALTILAATAAWSLLAVAAAQRALGAAELHRAALRRAELALATLDDAPCDSAVAPQSTRELRWRITTARTRAGVLASTSATVIPVSTRTDSVRARRLEWCR